MEMIQQAVTTITLTSTSLVFSYTSKEVSMAKGLLVSLANPNIAALS